MMEFLYRPMAYFVENSLLAFGIICLFLIILIGTVIWDALTHNRARRIRLWPLLLPLCLWTLYALWESSLVGKGYNIRIDLLVIYPVLVVSTTVGLVFWVRGFRKEEADVSITARQRSRCLTAVGILLMISGGWGIWSAQWVVPALITGLQHEAWRSGYAIVASLKILIDTVMGGVGYFLGGIGVLRLKRWARLVVLWIAAISLLWELYKVGLWFVAMMQHQEFQGYFGLYVSVAIPMIRDASFLWFLTRRSVKSQFAGHAV